MGWMNDSLEYFKRDPMYRSHHEGELSFSFVYAFSENFILPISHDEVVHGKGTLFTRMPGDHWQKLANMRAFLAYMWGTPASSCCSWARTSGSCRSGRKPRMDWWMLDQPPHRQLLDFVGALNRVYREHSPLWSRDSDGSAFRRLGEPHWNPNVIAFSRVDHHGNTVAVICNFSALPSRTSRSTCRNPARGRNCSTPTPAYGGSGVGNFGTVHADDNGRATLVLPPLGVLWLGHRA
jgi:1,4-alpha-glucan branching enzyme